MLNKRRWLLLFDGRYAGRSRRPVRQRLLRYQLSSESDGCPNYVVLGLAFLLGATLVIGAGPVGANQFGGPGTANYAANNGTHQVWDASSSLSDDLEDAVEYVLDYKYSAHPDIYAYDTSSLGSTNDVRVFSGNYGEEWYAAAPCSAFATYGGSGDGEYCRPRLIKFNDGQHPTAFDSLAEQRHFACHEVGHTLGLFHRSGGCMHTSGLSYSIDSHNYDHLDFYA